MPGPTLADLRLLACDSRRELAALRPHWQQLWEHSPRATPFQSPDWLLGCADRLQGGDVRAITLWHGGQLVGLLPLMLHLERGRRKLLLLGTGVSDYLDALVAPGWESACPRFIQYLADHRTQWDICDLHQLPADSPLLDAPPHPLPEQRRPHEPCPVLPLAPTLAATLPARQLQKLAYYRRRLHRAGSVEFVTATQHNLPELLHALFRLHEARWSAQGLPGVLRPLEIRRLHETVAPAMERRGLLRMRALRLDGRIVGCLYAWTSKRRAYYYIAGFDPAAASLSLGMILVADAIEQAIEAGAAEFDFLRGREPYKYRWGAVDRPTVQRRLFAAAALEEP